MVLERWVENPPEDYLQYVPIWVQISQIPVNYYNMKALSTLGDLVGKTKVVAFDPTKPITQAFVRVQVLLNVAHPLKKFRVLNLSGGKTATILFHYEKVHKRCFTCQHLNHEKSVCPLEVRKRHEEATLRRDKRVEHLSKVLPTLNREDPLFGVLEESQVGSIL